MSTNPLAGAASATVPCAECSTPIDPNNALYGDDGQVCDGCGANGEIRERLLRTIRSSGYGSIASAFASWVFNPFFALTLAALIGAIWTIQAYGTMDENERMVTQKHKGPMIAAVVGIVVATLPIGLALMGGI